MRVYISPLFGNKFCGDIKTREVHDLDSEDTSGSGCQIDEILKDGRARTFSPDTLEQAYAEGYVNCAKCIGSEAS